MDFNRDTGKDDVVAGDAGHVIPHEEPSSGSKDWITCRGDESPRSRRSIGNMEIAGSDVGPPTILGTVKSFSEKAGEGYIVSDKHSSDIAVYDFDVQGGAICQGDVVKFDLLLGKNGTGHARNVVVLNKGRLSEIFNGSGRPVHENQAGYLFWIIEDLVLKLKKEYEITKEDALKEQREIIILNDALKKQLQVSADKIDDFSNFYREEKEALSEEITKYRKENKLLQLKLTSKTKDQVACKKKMHEANEEVIKLQQRKVWEEMARQDMKKKIQDLQSMMNQQEEDGKEQLMKAELRHTEELASLKMQHEEAISGLERRMKEEEMIRRRQAEVRTPKSQKLQDDLDLEIARLKDVNVQQTREVKRVRAKMKIVTADAEDLGLQAEYENRRRDELSRMPEENIDKRSDDATNKLECYVKSIIGMATENSDVGKILERSLKPCLSVHMPSDNPLDFASRMYLGCNREMARLAGCSDCRALIGKRVGDLARPYRKDMFHVIKKIRGLYEKELYPSNLEVCCFIQDEDKRPVISIELLVEIKGKMLGFTLAFQTSVKRLSIIEGGQFYVIVDILKSFGSRLRDSNPYVRSFVEKHWTEFRLIHYHRLFDSSYYSYDDYQEARPMAADMTGWGVGRGFHGNRAMERFEIAKIELVEGEKEEEEGANELQQREQEQLPQQPQQQEQLPQQPQQQEQLPQHPQQQEQEQPPQHPEQQEQQPPQQRQEQAQAMDLTQRGGWQSPFKIGMRIQIDEIENCPWCSGLKATIMYINNAGKINRERLTIKYDEESLDKNKSYPKFVFSRNAHLI